MKVRADMLRTQIADIELMKHRMATKEEEIVELKKKLRMKVCAGLILLVIFVIGVKLC